MRAESVLILHDERERRPLSPRETYTSCFPVRGHNPRSWSHKIYSGEYAYIFRKY